MRIRRCSGDASTNSRPRAFVFLMRFGRANLSLSFPMSHLTSWNWLRNPCVEFWRACRLCKSRLLARQNSTHGVLAGLPSLQVEIVSTSPESDDLRDAYLEAAVVGPSSSNDAAHIAVATVSNVDMVVSWNFKHIVHFEKIGGYEGVNSLRGYRSPRIYSPREVVTP